LDVYFQRATPIVGARRPRIIDRIVFASITIILALPGLAAHASAAPARTGSCRSLDTILAKASTGLLMPSESDFPFTPFTWKGAATRELTTARVLELTDHAPGTAVAVTDLHTFFRNVASPRPWHDPQQAMDVRKFRRLVKVLEHHVTDIRVYRVGTIRIDAYIVGACGRNLAGLSTTLIET
jgi:hypothetical protein